MKTFLSTLALLSATSLGWAADVTPYSAVAAPEWTALFDAPYGVNDGWSGADGVYTIPMNGDERFGSGGATKTLILFSDSFVGGTHPDGSRIGGTVMVNNTSAMLSGATPTPSALQFNVRRDAAGKAISMVVPTQAGQWYWPGDALVWKGKVRMFAARMATGDGGDFNFKQVGVDLLTAPASDDAPFLGSYNRLKLPLFAPRNGQLGEIAFGIATMPLTVQAGAPNPDGFLYVYGVRSDDFNKKLLVARVKPDQMTKPGSYRFWNGTAWVSDINDSAPVANRMGAEISVTPLADGRFLVVHQLDTLSGTVVVRYGASPVGPFGKPIPVWLCPEDNLTPDTFVYGAKAHPHLSAPGELLISYHVNTFDFWENFSAGGKDIYRPRFIKLPL
ncbi:DUF4185 domain-containing protein [Ideonella sp. DXS29W]|uniref:DUF4185 domain-containing protein n=1 Tax=Ideonella lacteola TaxID=2984193 RepID=A0ABU9BJR7_9BURK